MATVFGVLPHEYEVDGLKQQCGDLLLANVSNETSAKDLCLYNLFASKYDLENVLQKWIEFVKEKTGRQFITGIQKYPIPFKIQSKIYEIICGRESNLLSRVRSIGSVEVTHRSVNQRTGYMYTDHNMENRFCGEYQEKFNEKIKIIPEEY